MQKIEQLFKIRPVKILVIPKKDKITNERQSVIKEFVERINAERIGTKHKKLPASAIAVKLSHLSLSDLYYFLSVAKQAKSFSAFFWWSLNADNFPKE